MDNAETRSQIFVAAQSAKFAEVKRLCDFWKLVDSIRDKRAWLKARHPTLDAQIGAAARSAWERLTEAKVEA